MILTYVTLKIGQTILIEIYFFLAFLENIFWLLHCIKNPGTLISGDTDGEDGIPLMGLMRSVEDALAEYNIDTRTCLARTMCNQYSTRSTTDDTPDRVGRGLLENLAK